MVHNRHNNTINNMVMIRIVYKAFESNNNGNRKNGHDNKGNNNGNNNNDNK